MWYDQNLEKRKNWYSEVADAYNRARPRYPQNLVNRVGKLASLSPEKTILELGCGPGIATTAFAKTGCSIVALEPNQKFCQLARQNCATYPNVEIVNTSFEEWELEAERFNAVLAASSFHWISSEVKYQKAADVLPENGHLILMWNPPPQPKLEIWELWDEVYDLHAPLLARYEDMQVHRQNCIRFGQDVLNSGLFVDLASEELVSEVNYSIDDYLALLSSLSPYMALEKQKRDSLFAGLREGFEKICGDSIPTSYVSIFQIFTKVCYSISA